MDTYSTGSTSGKGSTSKGTGSSGKDMGGSGTGTGMGMTKRSRNEDPVTSTIEQTTAKVPSVAFLTIAVGAIAGSLGFFLAGKREVGLFLATWVPTILIVGNYNKIVKALENIQEGGMESGSYGGGSGSYGGGSTGF